MKVTNKVKQKENSISSATQDIGAIISQKKQSYTTTAFGQKLVELRNENKLSQEESANRIGISRNTLSMYERGERCANIDVAVNVANVYNVTLDYLFGIGYKSKENNEMNLYDFGFSEETVDILMVSETRNLIDMVLSHPQFQKVTDLMYANYYKPLINSYEVNYISRLISDLLYAIIVDVSKDIYTLKSMTEEDEMELLDAIKHCLSELKHKGLLLQTNYDHFVDCEDNIQSELERIKILLENSTSPNIEEIKEQGFQEAIRMINNGEIVVKGTKVSMKQK